MRHLLIRMAILIFGANGADSAKPLKEGLTSLNERFPRRSRDLFGLRPRSLQKSWGDKRSIFGQLDVGRVKLNQDCPAAELERHLGNGTAAAKRI
jgi:hypothetical protein